MRVVKCKQCQGENMKVIPVNNIHGYKIVCQHCNTFVEWLGNKAMTEQRTITRVLKQE